MNPIHEFETSTSLLDPITTLTSLLFLLGLFALAIALVRRQRLLSFGLLWIFVHLAIESSIIGLEMAFEHRLYLPMFGFALIVSQSVFSLFPARRAVTAGITAVIIIGLAGAAHLRNRIWNSPAVLWADVVAKSPERARARSNLASALTEIGEFEAALEHFEAAIRLDPTMNIVSVNLANAHNNVVSRRVAERRIAEAIHHYREAARLRAGEWQITNSLAWLLATSGEEPLLEPDESVRLSEAAAQATARRDPAILDTLAAGYAAAGRFDEAVAVGQESARIHRNRGDLQQNFAVRKRIAVYQRETRYVDPILMPAKAVVPSPRLRRPYR